MSQSCICMSLARMKTKKPNKQPEPRGRRRPPPQAGGWSGPRGLPMTSAVAPGCWQSGHFQGGGAVHARHRHGSLNSAESAGPCSPWKPGLHGAAQRPVGSQPSPARVIGSNVAAGNKAGHTARQRAGCAGDGRSERVSGSQGAGQAEGREQPGSGVSRGPARGGSLLRSCRAASGKVTPGAGR